MLASLINLPPKEFLEHHIYDRIPYVFRDDRTSFISWKQRLSQSIEVDPACIQLVGSSALGISLNPNKGFKPFDEDSDIDVGIISHYHFTISWRYLRTQGHRRLHVDHKTRAAWDEHVNRLIYWGTIATDKLLGILPFGTQWISALTDMATVSPTIGRDVRLRIYSDFEALRAYQSLSVNSARDEAISTRR